MEYIKEIQKKDTGIVIKTEDTELFISEIMIRAIALSSEEIKVGEISTGLRTANKDIKRLVFHKVHEIT